MDIALNGEIDVSMDQLEMINQANPQWIDEKVEHNSIVNVRNNDYGTLAEVFFNKNYINRGAKIDDKSCDGPFLDDAYLLN